MKGLIYIDEKYLINDEFNLIESQTALLKICGKPLFEYYFDFLYSLGVDEIFIVGKTFQNQICQRDFVKRSRIKVTSIKGYTLANCYEKNFNLFKNDQLFVIENIGFIFDEDINKDSFKNNIKVAKNNFAIYYITEHSKEIEFSKFKQKKIIKIKSLTTVPDYINITNKILNNLSSYDSIPGYTKDNNIVIGKNVKIDSNCKLLAPLIILDNVRVCKGTTLGPNSIIGNDTFIEENSKVINSIIYDNTYVGEHLHINNKIVSSSYLIDKENIESYSVDDIFLSQNSTWFF